MTDNRTTELLRKLLDERGMEYEAYRDIKNRCITKWRTYHGAFVFFAVEKEGKLFVETASDTEHSAICTPEQAIAATLGSNQEANLGDALNEVAEKWAEAQVSAEEYAKRCRMLESLARDMFAYIDNCCESDLSFGCVDPVDCAYYDKARDWCTKASSLKQRMKALGFEVD